MSDMKHFDSAGVEIAYLDTGGGHIPGHADAGGDGHSPSHSPSHAHGGQRPPVLLIHGFASNMATNWQATGWIDTLRRHGRRVLAIDNRGHGRSAKLYALTDYGAPLMAEDARRLLDHLGIARAHVIGYSMGARISAFLTLAHPGRVASVVFGGLGINMVRGMAGTGPIAHALEADSLDAVTNPTARTFRIFAEQTGSDLKALAACIRSSRAPLTADMVAEIARPALIVVGEHDVIAGAPEPLAALIPNARALMLPGREHMKAVGDRTFKEAALRFIDEVDAAP